MTTKKKPSKFDIQGRAGVRTSPEHKRLLDSIATTLYRDHGLTVLSGSGDLWARVPGLLSWFCIAYRYDAAKQGAGPYGAVRVSLIRSGRVSVQVLGTREGGNEHLDLNLSWKE